MTAGRPPRYSRANAANFVNIPKELRDLPQWVVWRVHPREDGKPAKIPFDAKQASQAASITNPRSWSTFQQAVKAFEDIQSLAGIGFVFTAQDPYTGIDIDDCRDGDTGKIVDWGQAIINGLDSYAEVSPSGTGVKIIVRAVTPGSSARRNKVEIYSTARYFTITGEVLLPGLEVKERQERLDELYQLIFGTVAELHRVEPPVGEDDIARKLAHVQRIPDTEILELAMAAANGPKFSRLYDGDTTDCGGDHSRADLSLCCILAYWTRGDKARVDRLFRASKLMRPKWDERRGAETYGQRTLREACTMTTVAYDPESGAIPTRNDLGNADIFIRLQGEDFRYVRDWKIWLGWDGVCWRRDAGSELRLGLEKVSSILLREANQLLRAGNEDAPRAYKWALKAGEVHQIIAVDEVLRWRLGIDPKLLDQQPMRLAVGNGVLDLRDASITEGKRLDWLTRGTSIKYIPTATCPRFDTFMSEIMQDDQDMVDYLWRVLGYCLTGETTERAFFILHGEGKNGKTTFVEILHALLDRYAQVARFSTFLRKNVTGGGANDDIAHLAGARVVIASEADEAQSLDAATVKTLTGSDSVRARFLYGGEFEFKPNFKLLLVTNHVPRIDEASHALWDRLHYIPFTYRVTDEQLDKQLGLKLLGELEGILARAVEGCLSWQRDGLHPPQKVLKAVDDLREDMDPVGEFLKQAVEVFTNGNLVHARLYDMYQSWCRENGMKYPIPAKRLMKHMKSKGWECVEGAGHRRVWPNLRLRHGQDEEQI